MKVPLSQRDKRWASLKLGNSGLNLGTDGCLVTALAYLAETTPDIVNEKLKEVKGFSGAKVIWSKVALALPQLTLVKRGYTSNVPDGYCLVEVDFDGTPVTDDRHWVLYLPDNKLMDPWTGTIDDRSKYPIVTGYAQFNLEEGDTQVNLDSKIPQAVKDEFNLAAYGEFNNNEETWRTFIEKWKEYVTKYNTCKDSRDQDKEEFEKKIADLEEKIDKLTKDNAACANYRAKWDTCTVALNKLEETANARQETIATMTSDAREASKKVSDLEKDIALLKTQLATSQGQVDSYESEITWNRVWEFILSKFRR